jgi:hypothetical protein
MSISLLPVIKFLFNDNNPGVTKIKNTQYDSVYVCECKSMLRKERHYMFVIGAIDVIPIGSNVQIEDINTISCLQFRTFQEPIVQQVLTNYIDFDPRAGDLSIKRYNISKDVNGKKISEYMFEYERKPYNVHIFHATDSDYEFVPDGNLLSALITWDTMIMPSINVGSPPPSQQQKQLGNNDLEFEQRSRAQIRPRRDNGGPPPPQYDDNENRPLPPIYDEPLPESRFRHPNPSQSRPFPPQRPPSRRGEEQRPRSSKPRPPQPKEPVRHPPTLEPNFNPRPGSRKTASQQP